MTGPADESVVTYDPHNQWLLITMGDRSVQLEPVKGIRLQRGDPEEPDAYGLWLDAPQADVLVKMIGYILEKVRISEASQAALRGLLPEVRQIAAALGSPEGDE